MDFAGLDSVGDVGLIWEIFWTKYYVHVSDSWEPDLRNPLFLGGEDLLWEFP